MNKFKKTLLIFTGSIILFIIIVIAFISPITKYLIEKYDSKYTGREITVDWTYVNPFTGYIYINDLKIYELHSDSVFFSAVNVNGSISLPKLFTKTLEINQLTLDQPYGIIIKNKTLLNFSDMINRFSNKNKPKKESSLHVSILDVKINDAVFYFKEDSTAINYFIKNVNIVSTGKKWDVDTIGAKISFNSGIGTGEINGDFSMNVVSLDYRFKAIAHQFDLKIIEQYLTALINYGNFKADIDANIEATGNFKNKEDLNAKGLLVINNFHFGKNTTEDYASFSKFTLYINQLNPLKHIYLIDSASLQKPYFKLERYDNNLDNIQTMFGKKGVNLDIAKANSKKFNLLIEIAKYVKVLAKNFFKSNYKINRLAIYDGDFQYNDYTLNELFSVHVKPIYAYADSINKSNEWVKATFRTNVKPSGNAIVKLRINPKDSSDFDVNYHITELPVALFNPYLIKYTSYPLDRGTIELQGTWNVRSDIINSRNHLIIIDPRLNARIMNNDTKWIPMRIVMSFVRERGNVINYEIPITGNLKKPNFHLKDVLFDVLENIFVKPPTTPYRMEVKNIEAEIEKSLSLRWQMQNSSLEDNQNEFVEEMAEFLSENPKASISIYPMLYAQKEKELILLYEAKKKYFLSSNNINKKNYSEDDSMAVIKLSIKDSLFIRYLNKQIKDTILLFTVQAKCANIIDSAFVNNKYQQLNRDRKAVFMTYFKEKNVQNQIKFSNYENTIPFNGFSFYKIKYIGEYPEDLLKAYEQMNDLNNKIPRKKFKNKRKKQKLN